MKPTISLAVILGIACAACVEQPADPTSASAVLAVRRDMLSAERPAGRVLDLTGFAATVASSADLEIPGCQHVIEVDIAASRFRASASLSCEAVNEYTYLDIAAYVTDAARSQITLLTAAVVEEENAAAAQTFEITGAVKRGQVVIFDSLALIMNLDEAVIGYRQLDPSSP
jgi:hypothetical protein